jgi:hypothetical protein
MQPQTDTRELPNQAQLDLIARWPEIRKLWQSTLFGAFATTGPNGPQITPIGPVLSASTERSPSLTLPR